MRIMRSQKNKLSALAATKLVLPRWQKRQLTWVMWWEAKNQPSC